MILVTKNDPQNQMWPLTFCVDYSISVQELLKIASFEGMVEIGDDDVEIQNRPLSVPEKGKGVVDFGVFASDNSREEMCLTIKEIIWKMTPFGFRPASVKEALTFALNDPEAQYHVKLFCVGSFMQPLEMSNPSPFQGWRYAIVLGRDSEWNRTVRIVNGPSNGRFVEHHCFGFNRFLGVKF